MFAKQPLLDQEQSYSPQTSFISRSTALICAICVLVLLSLIALCVNQFFYHYPGNFYSPSGYFLAGINLSLMYGGFLLLQGRYGKTTQIVKEMSYYFLIMGVIVLATNAIQYTPFPAIDQHILRVESLLNIDTNAFITWTHAKPLFKTVLNFAYGSLDLQLCLIPLIVILTGRKALIREYYFLLITSVLIGFMFYYFFPTTAPASVIKSDYFNEEQRATYMKFFQLHHYIQPTTIDGGMIALPSFHVIWAWLCLYLLRGWPVAFLMLLPINMLLMGSCVLLGWHYCIDIIGSIVVLGFAHSWYRFIRAQEGIRGLKSDTSSFATA